MFVHSSCLIDCCDANRKQTCQDILNRCNIPRRSLCLCANTENCCCKAPLTRLCSSNSIANNKLQSTFVVAISYANLRNFNPAAPKPSIPSRTAPGTGTRLISPHNKVALLPPSGDVNSSSIVLEVSPKPNISKV